MLAGVNVASVNYHFGSKDPLVEAVFAKLAERVNASRTSALKTVREQAERTGRPASVEEIVQVFPAPYLAPNEQTHGELLAQFLLLNRLSPSPVTTKIMIEHFDPMARKFIEALSYALPDTPVQTLYWRYNFMARPCSSRSQTRPAKAGSPDCLKALRTQATASSWNSHSRTSWQPPCEALLVSRPVSS